MRKLKYFILSAVVCLCAGSAYADNYPAASDVNVSQQRGKVTGTVTDDFGPVAGAAVSVKGTTRGVATDGDGKFSLDANSGETIVVSFLGYRTQEIAYKGEPTLSIFLVEDAQVLDEVVVTALGMKRESKALGYAVTELKGDELKIANTISPVAALQGKVAGVEINQSDGGMFGSTKIQIRGASTLKKNNQPIYVIDGIILDNSTSDTGDADWDGDINDYGNELKSLNPDDHESVTILKGAAATALYGSRGLNGAVVITTKNGRAQQGLGISFSQTFGIQHVYKSPDLQNEYVRGNIPGNTAYAESGNRWDAANAYSKNADGVYSLIAQARNSSSYGWGPHISWFDGKQVEQYDGRMGSMKMYENNYLDAFKLGFNTNTNVAVQGGNDKTTFYTSLSYRYDDGITDNFTFNRTSLLAKASHKITNRVKLEASINFANSVPRNALRNLGEAFVSGTFLREYDTKYYKDKYKGSHGGLASSNYGDLYGPVPGKGTWWNINENDRFQKETSVRPTLELTVDFADWLTMRTGGNFNYYYIRGEQKNLGDGYQNDGGSYRLTNYTKEQTNAFTQFNANKQLTDDFEVHAFVRGEYYNNYVQSSAMNTEGGLIVPGQFFITNSKNQPRYEAKVEGTKRILSVAFQAGASWKNQLFVDVTGRNDWSSALVYANGTGNHSYFYPSVSGSWLINETLKEQLPDWISFMKVRASWAQVGNDTDPYYINSGYTLNSTQFASGYKYSLALPNDVKSTDLKPERKNAWEVGLDWRFFNNRLGLDLSYYKENTKDQIMSITVPSVSGINSQLINAGNIQNSGVEIALNTVPVRTKDFEWGVDFTYTKNDNKIISLHENVANFINLDGSADYGNYRIASVAKVGGSYGMLMTDTKPLIDEKTGMKVLTYSSNNRIAYYRRSGVFEELGDMIPDFLGSMSTSFTYKNLSLRVGLDARFGGYVASYNSRYGTAYGFTGTSLKYREGITWTSQYADSKGMVFTDGIIPDGVFAENTNAVAIDGSTVNVGGKTYKQCVDEGILEPMHLATYGMYTNTWGQGVINDDWIKELNYIALRDISLSYRVPSNISRKIGAKALSVTATGRNLGYLLNNAPNHENPESVRGTGSSNFRMRSFSPFTASYMFTINATF